MVATESYDQRCCYRIWLERWERAGLFVINCDDSSDVLMTSHGAHQPTTIVVEHALRRRLRLTTEYRRYFHFRSPEFKFMGVY
jgi:hypothetical protein